MTLPSYPNLISMSQVNVELAKPSTSLISLNDSNVRTLFVKTSGTISLYDGYSKQTLAPPSVVTLTLNTNEYNRFIVTGTTNNSGGTPSIYYLFNNNSQIATSTTGVFEVSATEDTPYNLTSYASNANGTQTSPSWSNTLSFTTPLNIRPPTSASLSYSSLTYNSVTLTVTVTGGTTPTYYKAYKREGDWLVYLGSANPVSNAFSIPLNESTPYIITVIVGNSAGNVITNDISFTTPSSVTVPTGVSVSVSSIVYNSFIVNLNYSGGSPPTSYTILVNNANYYGFSGSSGSKQIDVTESTSDRSFTVQVYATNSAGNSSWSNQVQFTIPAHIIPPSNISLNLRSQDASSFVLSTNVGTGTADTFFLYLNNLYTYNNNRSGVFSLTTLGTYIVYAYNSTIAQGGFSSAITVTQVETLTVSLSNASSYGCSATMSYSGGRSIGNYNLYLYTTSYYSPPNLAYSGSSANGSFTVTGLSPSTTYYAIDSSVSYVGGGGRSFEISPLPSITTTAYTPPTFTNVATTGYVDANTSWSYTFSCTITGTYSFQSYNSTTNFDTFMSLYVNGIKAVTNDDILSGILFGSGMDINCTAGNSYKAVVTGKGLASSFTFNLIKR